MLIFEPRDSLSRCKVCGGMLEYIQTFYKSEVFTDIRCVNCGRYYFDPLPPVGHKVGRDPDLKYLEIFRDDFERLREEYERGFDIHRESQGQSGGDKQMKPRAVTLTLELAPNNVPVKVLRKKANIALMVMVRDDPNDVESWERMVIEQVQANAIRPGKEARPCAKQK